MGQIAWARAAFVEISRPGGAVVARWCSCWPGPDAVTWDGRQWAPLRGLAWSALDSHASAATQATLTTAWLPSAWRLLEVAAREQWTVSLSVLQFDEADGATGPPADAALVATYLGQVRGLALTGSPPSLVWRLGLDSGGAFPPLQATTYLIGTPCVL